MTAPTHVYVTAHGAFQSGSWLGESAQFGLRLTSEAVVNPYTRGSIFTPLGNGDVSLDQGTTAGTHGTLTRTFSFRMGLTGSSDNWDAAAQVDIAEDLWTFLDAIKAYHHTTWKWTHIKQVPVGADGRAIGYASSYVFSSGVVGTASSMSPPQCAAAVSLRAPITGRRGRGRIYLPALGTNLVNTSGMLDSTGMNAIRAAFVTLVGNLENGPGTPAIEPCVSIMSHDSATAVKPTQIRTGNRVDTIRSRREQVAETYTSTDL